MQSVVGYRNLFAAEALRTCYRAAEQLEYIVLRKRLEHEDLAPREQSPVDLERGVLGRRPDKDDAPLFDEGQESILLRLVEAVYLVDEKDRLFAVNAVLVGALHHLADLLDPAGDGGKVDERGVCAVRYDVGESGLPYSGRAPEDHRGDHVAFDDAAQYLTRTDQMLLSDDLVECLRAQARGKRLGHVAAEHAKGLVHCFLSFRG